MRLVLQGEVTDRFLKEEHGVSKESNPKSKGAGSGVQPAPQADQQIVTEEQVRRRAYEIYLNRGAKPGDPLQDWLQAERELKAELVYNHFAASTSDFRAREG